MNMYQKLSFKQDEQRKKFIILLGSLVSLLMVSVLVAVSIFTAEPKHPSHLSIVSKVSTTTTTPFPCKQTLYPEACQSLVLSTKDGDKTPATVTEMFDVSIKYTVDQVNLIRSLVYNASRTNQNTAALDDCIELLDHSLHQLDKITDGHKTTTTAYTHQDIQTWLSAAITHQRTCLDSLQSHEISKEKDSIDANLQNNIQHISNSLSLHKSIVSSEESKTLNGGGNRKLLSDDFPTWVSSGERKLLEASIEDLEVNAVVAMDGTGTHKTIAEAISLAGSGGGRTVIHVKAGTYNENNINVPLKQSNVMLVGDGKGATVITGSKSSGGGYTTFQSATFGVSGDGFIARDITFVNSAGPAQHQAVALRVSSDKSVFYRCSIIGYQDTLYTLSNRQFYRETDIYGTVDFIFGDSAVVFQNCNIFPRKPQSQQKNFITAQGRSDPNQNTGISFHKCRIAATSDLAAAKIPTYLGRPWMKYSRTVFMQSYLDGSINSAGWYPWEGSNNQNTAYYAEYMNTGPGASTSGRIKWPGYHPALSATEAAKFTVGSLISGTSWLPSTGIIFQSGL